MQRTAKITIYIQALGGKFLGPNAYNHEDIKLSLTLRGNTIPVAYKLKENGNDGWIEPNFINSLPSIEGKSSFLPILTPIPTAGNNPAVNYLTPNNLTICGIVTVPLPQSFVLGTVSASIPSPLGEDLLLTQSIVLNYMQKEYRVILIVPGLLLEAAAPPSQTGKVSVYVKMMCGCPITTGIPPNTYWASCDFNVTAEAVYTKGSRESLALTFTSNETKSLFQADVNAPDDIRQVNFTARQKSTGNIGYLPVAYSK